MFVWKRREQETHKTVTVKPLSMHVVTKQTGSKMIEKSREQKNHRKTPLLLTKSKRNVRLFGLKRMITMIGIELSKLQVQIFKIVKIFMK